jgi:hypothetical protein
MKCVHFIVCVSEFSPHNPPNTSSELRKVFVDDEREVGTQDSSEPTSALRYPRVLIVFVYLIRL